MTLLDDVDTLRTIVESLPVGVVVCDQQGKSVCFNPEAERILGIGARDVTPAEWTTTYGCYLPDMLTPYPPEQLPLARALRGEELHCELIFVQNARQPSGLWITVSGRSFRDKAGTILGGVVVFRDVTEAQNLLRNHTVGASPGGTVQKSPAGTELMGYADRFEQLRGFCDQLCRAVEHTADSVVITDRRGVIEYVNPAFEETTGYASHEVLGQTPRLLKSGRHDKQFYANLWNQLLAGRPFQGTIMNRKKSGELYWVEQTITPTRDENEHITHFVSVLKDVTASRRLQEQEFHLQFAREVQQCFCDATVSLPSFDIAGATHPAAIAGGDYFDFILQPDGSVCVAIGDVIGHGFGSALVMATARAYVRSYAKLESDMGSVLSHVNDALAVDFHGDRYITLALLRLDPVKRSMEYAGAGHVPGYLLRPSGEIRLATDSTGRPAGIFPNQEFSSSSLIQLDPGESIILLTDGITETVNVEEVEFGAERALDFVRRHPQKSARDLVEGIHEAARMFADGAPQHDDMTAIVCKVSPIA